MNRLKNLDYLRGLAAFGILTYHYSGYVLGHFDSNSFLGRVGIFGVSIFYILSGLTLYHVYYNKILSKSFSAKSFFLKRMLRIYPLLIAVLLIVTFLNLSNFNLHKFLFNITGLFGFLEWDNYLSTGVWSIGNELVFYSLFPIFLIVLKAGKPTAILLTLTSLVIFTYYSYFVLNTEIPLQSQWHIYANPINQIPYFIFGILIGHFTNSIQRGKRIFYWVGIAGIALFIFYPVKGDQAFLNTGITRFVFLSACMAMVISLLKTKLNLPSWMDKPLSKLGEISYGVYLIHPIAWTICERSLKIIYPSHSASILLISSVGITIITALISYEYFEKYFIQLGKKYL